MTRLGSRLCAAGFAAVASLPATGGSVLPGNVVDVRAGEFFFQAPDSIPAGLTTFRLTQAGMLAERSRAGLSGRALVADRGDNTRGFHMLWVVRLEDGKTISDLHRAEQTRAPTPWARVIGGPASAIPPRTTNATLDLPPGNYALVCHVGGAREDRTRSHLLNGKFRALTVVAKDGPAAKAPVPDVTAQIVGDGSIRLSRPFARGRQVIRVENATDREYEFKFQRVMPPLTASAFMAQRESIEPGLVWGGLSSVPAGGTVTTTMEFEPGEYVVGTWPPIRHRTSVVFIVAPR